MSEFEANVLHRKALSVKARGPVSWTCGKGADQWLERGTDKGKIIHGLGGKSRILLLTPSVT